MKIRIWYTLKGKLERELIDVVDFQDAIEYLERFIKNGDIHVVETYIYSTV